MRPLDKLGFCTIDEQRRIVLPDELNEEAGWEAGTKISVHYVDNTTIVLQVVKEPIKALIFD